MARVRNPLQSQEASGRLGDIVFGTSRGQNIVRRFVIPSNPNTQGQQDARQVVALHSIHVRAWNRQSTMPAGHTQTVKEYYTARRVNPATWNSFALRANYPGNSDTLTADRAAYAALTEQQRTAWTTEAETDQYNFTDRDSINGGAVITAGEQLFVAQRSLFRAGYLQNNVSGAPVNFV